MRIIPLNHWCSLLLATNRPVTFWWQCFSFYPFNKYSFSTLIVKMCFLNRDSTKNAWRYQYGFFLWLHYTALYHIKCLVLPKEITCNFFLSLVLGLAKKSEAYRKKKFLNLVAIIHGNLYPVHSLRDKVHQREGVSEDSLVFWFQNFAYNFLKIKRSSNLTNKKILSLTA